MKRSASKAIIEEAIKELEMFWDKSVKTSAKPGVSVVIPIQNEEKSLAQHLHRKEIRLLEWIEINFFTFGKNLD